MATFTDIELSRLSDRHMLSGVLGFPVGQVFYVNSSVTGASDTLQDGLTQNSPFATLNKALGQCSNSHGDVVVLGSGHAETLAVAGITMSNVGVTVLGQGRARSRPTLTCGAADVVGITLSGTSNWIKNVRFIGSVSQTGATSAILSVSGADNIIEGCIFEHGGAGPLAAVLLAAAHRTEFLGCKWLGTAAGPDMALKGTAVASNDIIVRDCVFNYGSVNVDSAVIGTLASGGFPGAIIERCIMLGANSNAVRNLGSYAATVPDGIVKECYVVSSVGITLGAAMPFDLGGLGIANCYWTDAVAACGLWIAAQQVAVISNASKAPILSPGPT